MRIRVSDPGAAASCPFCDERVADEALVRCPSCEVALHEACAAERDDLRCTTLGCGAALAPTDAAQAARLEAAHAARARRAPATATAAKEKEPPLAPRPVRSRWRRLRIAVLLSIVLLLAPRALRKLEVVLMADSEREAAARAHYDAGERIVRDGLSHGWDGEQAFDDAIAEFDRAIELDPELADAYSQRGFVRSWKHDDAGMLADYQRACELAPSDSVNFYRLGGALNGAGRHAEAAAALTRSIELTPPHLTGHLAYPARAEARRALGDVDGALADLRKHGDHELTGDLLLDVGRASEALLSFRRMASTPEDYAARSLRKQALAHLALGDQGAALEALRGSAVTEIGREHLATFADEQGDAPIAPLAREVLAQR